MIQGFWDFKNLRFSGCSIWKSFAKSKIEDLRWNKNFWRWDIRDWRLRSRDLRSRPTSYARLCALCEHESGAGRWRWRFWDFLLWSRDNARVNPGPTYEAHLYVQEPTCVHINGPHSCVFLFIARSCITCASMGLRNRKSHDRMCWCLIRWRRRRHNHRLQESSAGPLQHLRWGPSLLKG